MDQSLIPAEAKDFFPLASLSRPALRIQPESYTVGTEVSFSGVKRGRSVTVTIHSHLGKNLVGALSLLHLGACMEYRDSFTFFHFMNIVGLYVICYRPVSRFFGIKV
jgi:hypothetical protein